MDTGNGQTNILAFRQHEVDQLFRWIKDGESASIIGVSNIGKSNLFQYLLDPQVQRRYLLGDAPRYLILRVSFFNLPEFNSRSVYSLILEQMELLDQSGRAASLDHDAVQKIGKYHETVLDAGQDELKIQRFFRLAVRICLQDPDRHLVLLFDQFDRLYQKAEDQLFINLRGLRDTYKYQISYLVFTRDALPDLPVDIPPRGSIPDDVGDEEDRDTLPSSAELAREEFYELLQPNQLYLKPYDLGDTGRLLRSISKRRGLPLAEDWIPLLYELTGGHAGLLRLCYSCLAGSEAHIVIEKDTAALLALVPLRIECGWIWASLSDDEQTALASLVKKQKAEDVDPATWSKLEQKGILVEGRHVFSPLFAQFAGEKRTRLNRLISLDARRQIIYYRGQRCKQLSKSEYLIFKKLYDRRNSVVSYKELLHACWPDDPYDEEHSPVAITAHIHRIRGKLGFTDKDKIIVAKSGLGYILNTEPAA